jgi:hypothetical protein
MQSYHLHTISMFNPINIEKVSIQATHLEANKGKHVEYVLEEPHEFKKQQKGKGESNKKTIVKKDEDKNPTCSHCENKGHDENHCWKLHPELKPKLA